MTEPVRRIRVKVRRFFKIDETLTDNSGFFNINKGYRQKASVILKFSNNRATTFINDQVSGFTMGGIFRGFEPGSVTVTGLKDAILANNGFSQSTQVNTLATSYGW